MAGVCVTVWFPEIVGFPSKDLNFGVFVQKTKFGPIFFGPILRWFGQGGKRAPSSKPKNHRLIDGFLFDFSHIAKEKIPFISKLCRIGINYMGVS